MSETNHKIRVVILAGGEGKRMLSPIPKVLHTINGKPMLRYVLESVEKSQIDPRPIIVVGYKKEEVVQELGNGFDYAIQKEQLGTGHAIKCAMEFVGDATTLLVLNGDQPFTTEKTIRKIAQVHLPGTALTMATVVLPDFEDWRSVFLRYGKIKRDAENKIEKIIEYKDASEEEKNIKEININVICLDVAWAREALNKIENNNAQNEYYWVDLLRVARAQGKEINSIEVEAEEALGANSKEELVELEKWYNSKHA